MKNLSDNLVRAANKMDQKDPWLVLLDLKLSGNDSDILRIVNNTEDIVFQGHTYIAFSFDITYPKESTKGEIPTASISVCNINRVVQQYAEMYDGGVGADVTIYVINAGLIDDNYTELTATFTVLGTKCNAKVVTLTLGPFNPVNNRFPPDICLAVNCTYKFKVDPRCGYNGTAVNCNRTLDNCRALGNQRRFGGHPGLDGRGIRLV